MPNRILRDKILTSSRLNELSAEAEAFYYRLMVTADDLGRFDAHSASIGTKCYPLKVPPVTRMASFAEFMGKIEAMLQELAKAKLIFLYEVGSQRFGAFYKWEQRQRVVRKKFPDPPKEVMDECALDCDAAARVDGKDDGQLDGQDDRLTPTPTPTPKRKNNSFQLCQPELFAEFWDAYPKKVGKQNAERAFGKAVADVPDRRVLLGVMLTAISQQKRSQQWVKDGGMFIPHPATWLNQRRWEDQLDPAVAAPPEARVQPARPSADSPQRPRELWQVKKDIEAAREQLSKILDFSKYGFTGSYAKMKAMAEAGHEQAKADLADYMRIYKRKEELELEARRL